MQQVIAAFGDELRSFDLPAPDELLMPGVLWGRHEDLLSPAYWAAAAWMAGDVPRDGFQLGKSLPEEVAACLLGGHGMPAEVGLAAYYRVRDSLRERKDPLIPEADLFSMLSEPLQVRGRLVRYRFARQRSAYLARSLELLRDVDEAALDDVTFRDRLLTLPGIGAKTASWIVRNRRASDAVAILDVHVIRACAVMGVFAPGANPSSQYRQLEALFLEFCRGSGARASVMDAVMWGQMRTISPQLLRIIVDRKHTASDAQPPVSKEVEACLAMTPPETIGRRRREAPVPSRTTGLSTAPRRQF
jgi:thermostable 8-oxoguanine DNA glycosylase